MRRRRLWPFRRSGPDEAGGNCEHAPAAVATRTDGPLLLTDPVTPPPADPAVAPPPEGGLYLAHFGLTAAPFSLLPDPDFLFWSPGHRRAHAVLDYALMSRAPLCVVTGEIGAGKTTLVHQLLRGLGEDVRVGLIANASGLRGEILHWVLMALGQTPAAGARHDELFATFQDYVIREYAAGRRVVLIFDEAQTLPMARLEEIRMLTNINTGTDTLLQIVLVGQPELRATVLRPDMAQLAQRAAASVHLSALGAEATHAYVHHRLAKAGARRPLFDDDALAQLHAATGGIPRLINQLCDLSMLYAYSADKTVVDSQCIQHVLDDGVLLGARPHGDTGAAPASGSDHDPDD